MTSQGSDDRRAWLLAPLLTTIAVGLFYGMILPPGTLPFSPGADVSDAAVSHWPAAFFLRQSVLQHGQIPLWSPMRMLGQPFAANPLNKVWYPLQWLVLLFPPSTHISLMIYSHLGWLIAGTFRVGRRAGWPVPVSIFSVLSVALGAKMVAHLGAGHLDIVYALAWVPWVALAAHRFVASPAVKPAAVLSVSASMLVLADLRIAFYCLPLVALAVLGTAWHSRKLRVFLPLAAVSGVLFLLLTAVQIVPILALGRFMTRTLMTPADAAEYSLPASYLAGLVFPDLGGFHEWMTFVSVPVLVLSVCAFARTSTRRQNSLVLVLALIALLWSLGNNGPVFLPVARTIPLVSWFRVPSRAFFIVYLSLVWLSASGFESLLSRRLHARARLAAVALTFAGLLWWIAGIIFIDNLPAQVTSAGLAAASTGAGILLIGTPFSLGRISARVLGVGLIIITLAVSLGLVGSTLLEGRTLDDASRQDNAILSHLGSMCEVVYAPAFDLLGPSAYAAGMRTLHGVDPFQVTHSAALIADVAGTEFIGYSVLAPAIESGIDVDPTSALASAEIDFDRMAALGVSWVVTPFTVDDDRLSLAAVDGDRYYYSVSGGPRFIIPMDDLNIGLRPGENRYHPACDTPPNQALSTVYETLPEQGDVMHVIPQAWAPGWKAFIDGRPVVVQRVYGALIGVPLDPIGPHTVDIVYRPTADIIAAGISIGTAVALAAWAVLQKVRS